MGRLASAAISAWLTGGVLWLVVPGWCGVAAHREFRPSQGRVIIVIAGGISVRDVARPELRQFARLFQEGSGALMNVRTGKPTKDAEPPTYPGMLAGCLSLGAGAMASGGVEVARAYDALANLSRGEISDSVPINVGEVYASRTGRDWSPTAVYQIEIVKIKRINEAAAYRASPGLLGSALRAAGIRTAVVGNSDIPGEIHREAAAAAMDEWGAVDGGTVSSPDLIRPDPGSAFGIRANAQALLRHVRAELARSRFLVVDFGDTLRADAYGELCSDEQAAALREAAVRRLDTFVGRLRGILDVRRDLLIVLSPCSRSFSEFEQERLAPILMVGPRFEHGLLRSPSTRRSGVVTLIDVAPTVLRFFEIDAPEQMVGRPVTSEPARNTADTLLRLNKDSINHAEQLSAMRGGSVFQAVVVVFATVGLLFGGGSIRRAAAWCAVVPAIMPPAMLFVSPLYSGGLAGSVLILALLVGAMLGLCVALLRSPIRSLAWACGLLTASLICDLALGSPLGQASMAGYSVVDGARYYGLGNELMGSLLGSTLAGTALLLASGRVAMGLRGAFAAAVFVVVFVFIGLPSLGANGGGALAAAPAFGTVLALRSHWRPSLRGIGALALCAVAAVVAVIALDAARAGQTHSHLGRALWLVSGGDWRALASIAARKMELNFMLLSTSLWSRLLIVSLAGSAVLAWLTRKSARSEEIRASLVGLLVGTMGAFLFNDSGVVAAAACAVLMWSLLAISVRECAPATAAAGTSPAQAEETES